MEEESNQPEWLIENKNNLNKIEQQINKLSTEGYAEIKSGLGKVRQAQKLKEEINYIKTTHEQINNQTLWNDETIRNTGMMAGISLSFIGQNLDNDTNINEPGGKVDDNYFYNQNELYSSTDLSSGSAVYLSAKIEERIHQIKPIYRPIYQSDPPPQSYFQEQKPTQIYWIRLLNTEMNMS